MSGAYTLGYGIEDFGLCDFITFAVHFKNHLRNFDIPYARLCTRDCGFKEPQSNMYTAPMKLREGFKEKAKPLHPLALVWPWMTRDEFESLKSSIKKDGQRQPCAITQDGLLVDGKNRELACLLLGIEPKYHVLPEGVSPEQWVMTTNRNRRNLNPSQQAMAAARWRFYIVQKCKESGQKKPSVETIAHVFNVSKRLIDAAIFVLSAGDKVTIADVDTGTRVTAAAAKILRHVERMGKKAKGEKATGEKPEQAPEQQPEPSLPWDQVQALVNDGKRWIKVEGLCNSSIHHINNWKPNDEEVAELELYHKAYWESVKRLTLTLRTAEKRLREIEEALSSINSAMAAG